MKKVILYKCIKDLMPHVKGYFSLGIVERKIVFPMLTKEFQAALTMLRKLDNCGTLLLEELCEENDISEKTCLVILDALSSGFLLTIHEGKVSLNQKLTA
ncbi:MAG: hypothetical protein AB4038_03320 [Prochloraceae cyanobacterium]